MTESLQKKRLRARPPRVRITYDVETGGNIEKRELPFVVGILADLSGDRAPEQMTTPFKERVMTDIDRDNFNEVMKSIRPRVDLLEITKSATSIAALLSTPDDQQLMFEHIADFEPMRIIQQLPGLRSVYESRGLIRSLQARCASDDDFAQLVRVFVLNKDTTIPGENPPASDTEASRLRKALMELRAADKAETDVDKTLLCLSHLSLQLDSYLENNADINRQDFMQKHSTVAVIDELVTHCDQQLSSALNAILHCPGFKQLEATWRGLAHLVVNTETGPLLKLRVFNAQLEELRRDLIKAIEFDQSALFKLIYEAEYGTYGGAPYSLLVGAYEIGADAADIDFLKNMSAIAAAAHAPFIAAASSNLFGLSGFEQLNRPRELAKIFEAAELSAWHEFRQTEEARYVSLVMPRVLLRLPYGRPDKRTTIACEGLDFEEIICNDAQTQFHSAEGNLIGYAKPDHQNLLWGNAAYVLAERITHACALYSWPAAIRGVRGGGLIEGLPSYSYTNQTGSQEMTGAIEVSISERRDKELSDLGFIALSCCKASGRAAIFGGRTTHLPKKYFSDDANAQAKMAAMLPCVLAESRFMHYIKAIMRDQIGSFMTRANLEAFLNRWIANYVLLDEDASQEAEAAYPLREASVHVSDVPGEPGTYRATVFLKPHFQLEELSTAIRLVTDLPG
ncbi:type VI secretion system contractile sheath large subunit [Undibacterium sp. CY7W]|uniref:Type VI secretion system contractile sheath large subunit n=1 Tax=Undibacterium rugosum TaxID=2762291 RepID=A0A923KZ71_9BURK|nr:type VI secretion system contractile sheath large subunit [Undibacterium rugosum]MBC3935538.1 type VI secretion system contractile sheath large subunit [Undibacterium rugosum]